MNSQALFSQQKADQWRCPCGCGRDFGRETGFLHHSQDGIAVYRLHFLKEREDDPHLWLLLGTGSWLASESKGSWIAVHSWIADDQVIARIEDPDNAPFNETDVFDERLLTRDEVFAQPGGSEWVFRCHDLIVDNHPEVARFFGVAP